MKFVVIIPAYNEEDFISACLDSIVNQTLLPTQLILVNDNSTDNTLSIIENYQRQHSFIKIVSTNAMAVHMPGSKVIQTFYKGYQAISIDYNIIFKLDADLIFPPNYFEEIINLFKQNETIGMAGGVATILKNGLWEIEGVTNLDHIRGALKSYSKNCFEKIGGLKKELGWDTLDEYLARFYAFKVIVEPTLEVKHLRPTGNISSAKVATKQGKAFYKLGYGWLLSLLAAIKMAYKRNNFLEFINYVKGYTKAYFDNESTFVNKEEAAFIRKYRWNKIIEKYTK